MNIYIGNENIYSPLGISAEENYLKVEQNFSGIDRIKDAGFNNEDLYLSKFANQSSNFLYILEQAIKSSNIAPSIWQSPRTKIILSSTKGDIQQGVKGAMLRAFNGIKGLTNSFEPPLLISNACISGVVAITKAAELIEIKAYDNVIVVGCDVVSDFVINGFQALYAMSEMPCMPYDVNRTGINLGEACSIIMLSSSTTGFKESPLLYLGGSSTNDANHISGPSRTGEGLFRSVEKTLKKSNKSAIEIGFINAHGTATKFNDDMESIAFSRLGMSACPLNSLKGYFGHTLGAAGVVETALSMQALRKQTLLATKGLTEVGTTDKINAITKTRKSTFECFLKTASGFGGGNASLIISKN